MSPLAFLKEGESAEIVANRPCCGHMCRHDCCSGQGTCHCGHNHPCRAFGTDHASRDHLAHMGLRPGKQVEMISNNGTGPLVLRLEECRIAVGRGVAMKIYVRRNEA